MPSKRVFFSFHYDNVIDFRANVVRNHWVTKPDREACGFFDHSIWESAKKIGPTALKKMINAGLDGSSVSCVLIGSQTYTRPWVRYELLKSWRKGNKMLGVHVNSLKGKNDGPKPQGPNPLDFVGLWFSEDGKTGTYMQWLNGAWVQYTEIDGSATFSIDVAAQYRGKGFKLSNWYPTYDWIANDGFNNFPTWVA